MSEFNSEPIDIVIPWVNPNDETWKASFNYWKEKLTGNKDACRYRDWGFIRYVLRSIDENCPWCRYVFLILASPSQVPDWLNTSNPRLKIVYHEDYIPKEFLPTFNSNVIELFYSRIEELSENFILCNDDTFFCTKQNESFFFKNNIPLCTTGTRSMGGTHWEKTLRNSMNTACDLLKANRMSYCFNTEHLPVCYTKSLQQFILSKINLSFMQPNKFRKDNDLTHFMFYDTMILSKHFIATRSRGRFYLVSSYAGTLNFNCPVMCVNEGEQSSASAIKNCLTQVSKRFSKKTGFEK